MVLSRSIGAQYDEADASGAQPRDMRLALAALLAPAGLPPRVRPGVLDAASDTLVKAGDGWAYRVGTAVLALSRTAYDGVHLLVNDGNVDVPCPAAPGTGSRIDVVWVAQPSTGENGDTTSVPTFGVASGTAVSGTPAVPTIPAGATSLAQVLVPSTATSAAATTITQTWQWTSLRGAPVPVLTETGLAGIASPRNGDLATNRATGDLWVRVADSWVKAATADYTTVLLASYLDVAIGVWPSQASTLRLSRSGRISAVHGVLQTPVGYVVPSAPVRFATLPERYWPATATLINVTLSGSGYTADNTARITVQTNGDMQFNCNGTATGRYLMFAGNTWVS